jgi:hypothetical protein
LLSTVVPALTSGAAASLAPITAVEIEAVVGLT